MSRGKRKFRAPVVLSHSCLALAPDSTSELPNAGAGALQLLRPENRGFLM
jgi:hypothetical protein